MSGTEKKIQNFIGQFFMGPARDSFDRHDDLAKQLLGYGIDAIDPILEELFQRKAAGTPVLRLPGFPVWDLLEVVEKCAERRHAEQVARMLSWEELVQGTDRSYRIMIPQILKRIGDSSVVPALEAFAEKVKGIEYEDYHVDEDDDHVFIPASAYNRLDQQDIAAAIADCKERR